MHPSLPQLQKIAIEAAHTGGKVLLRYFRKKIKATEKAGNQGLVTIADLQSEKTLIKLFKQKTPHFGILAEESGAQSVPDQNHPPQGRWLIDPLDGTTNFAHGLPNFCISIAAEWEGQVVVGVIYQPVLNETYTAMIGKGAFCNKKRLHVSATRKLNQSFLSTGFSSHKDLYLDSEISTFQKLSISSNAIRRPGSAAMDLANVARGTFDGFWERGLSPWDIAAGSLLITEAGGKVSTLSGQKLELNSKQILASNGHLHRTLVSEING